MPLLFFIQAEHHAALEQAELRYQDQKKVLLDEQNKVKEELRQVYLDQQGIGNKIKLEQAQELSSVRKSMEQDVRKMEEKSIEKGHLSTFFLALWHCNATCIYLKRKKSNTK